MSSYITYCASTQDNNQKKLTSNQKARPSTRKRKRYNKTCSIIKYCTEGSFKANIYDRNNIYNWMKEKHRTLAICRIKSFPQPFFPRIDFTPMYSLISTASLLLKEMYPIIAHTFTFSISKSCLDCTYSKMQG